MSNVYITWSLVRYVLDFNVCTMYICFLSLIQVFMNRTERVALAMVYSEYSLQRIPHPIYI